MAQVDKNAIENMIKQKGGIAKTADFVMLGMSNKDVTKLVQRGVVSRVRHGYYQINSDLGCSDEEIIIKLFPDGVLCMDTALFHYGYSDRTPLEWTIAFDRTVTRSRLKIDYPNIKPYFIDSKYIDIGKTKQIMNGIDVIMYDKERVICDCLKYKNKIDVEMFNKAIQNYVHDDEKNIKNLIEYSKKMRMYNKAKDLIGVWF